MFSLLFFWGGGALRCTDKDDEMIELGATLLFK